MMEREEHIMKKNELKCKDCDCFYADENGERPYCHFEKRSCYDIAPCETENEQEYSAEYYGA